MTAGVEKVVANGLVDTIGRPMHDLRISVLDRCNFRCPYCMPVSEYHEDYQFLTRRQRLDHEEIARIASVATRLGVSKLRLTGGEPLLDKGVPALIAALAGLPGVDDVAMTTNGMLLEDAASKLVDAGLHRVTVSLDSLDPDVFHRMSGGRGDLERVLRGIEAAAAAGLAPVKINTVVQRGVNEHTVLELVEHFRGTGHIVRMIEFMDVGNRNHWRMDEVVPSRELLRAIGDRWPVSPVDRNYRGEVASRYAFDDGQGEIGFISSVTEPFCGDCSRARLSADGVFYTCLFATQGTDLRTPLRDGADDAAMEKIIRRAWQARADRYSELRRPGAPVEQPLKKVEMYRIGG